MASCDSRWPFSVGFGGQRAFEILFAVAAAAGAGARPVRHRGKGFARDLLLGAAFIRIKIVAAGIEIGGGAEILGGERLVERRGIGALGRMILLARSGVAIGGWRLSSRSSNGFFSSSVST